MIIVGRLIKGIFGGIGIRLNAFFVRLTYIFRFRMKSIFFTCTGTPAASVGSSPIDLMIIFEKNRSLSNWFLVNAIDEKAEEGDFLYSIAHSNSFMEPRTASSDTSPCHPQYPP